MKKILDKLRHFFSIMCIKCESKGMDTIMDKKYYMQGIPDSMYWTCKVCGHKEDMPD